MGKGAFVAIQNLTDEILEVSYPNKNNVYDNGDQHSDFTPITGRLNEHASLPTPTPSSSHQYIEAMSGGGSFDMKLTRWGTSDSATLAFGVPHENWGVANPLVKLEAASLQFTTVVTPSKPGEQDQITVSIRYTIDPQSWMEDVSQMIWNTPLCMLPIPGSHDAMSYPDISLGSQTQSKTIYEQLMAGFRYFDFRVMVRHSDISGSAVYYGYHGAGSHTEHDYTAADGTSGNKPYILKDIRDFLDTHEQELVILNFSHFSYPVGDQFTPEDARNFVLRIQEHFALPSLQPIMPPSQPPNKGGPTTMLVPRSKGPTVTYGDCIGRKQQVVVIISDGGDDTPYAQDWYTYPANTPEGKSERENSLFWTTTSCWRDCYSNKKYDLTKNLDGVIIDTLQDQEKYLTPPSGEDHRDPSKFWVTQAVLNYSPVPADGHSLNYWGAGRMNPWVTLMYETGWREGRSWNWGGQGTHPISPPNILLLDFAGEFDGFPEACTRMVAHPNLPVLDIKGNVLKAGTAVIVWPQNTSKAPNQLWTFNKRGDENTNNTLIPYGYIQNQKDSSLVLDVEGGNLTLGAAVIVQTKNPTTASQLWTFTPDRHIQSHADPSLVLAVEGSDLTAGAAVIVWTQHPVQSLTQLWILTNDGHIVV